MDVEDAIAIVDAILGANALSDLQEEVFRLVWAREKYPDIAETLGYDSNYIKDLGAKIWKQLSAALEEKVTKSNIQSVLRRHQFMASAPSKSLRQDSPDPNSDRSAPRIDWGERIETSAFIGQHQPLQSLSNWLQDETCRLIALIGIAGIGKTTLGAKLAELNAEKFDRVIWRSLLHPITVPQLVQDLLQSLQLPAAIEAQQISLEEQIALLLSHFNQSKCLIVLDSTETLINEKNLTGDYQLGYEAYHTLFQQFGSTRHQSTILIIGREKPKTWNALEGDNRPVRSFVLTPLVPEDAQALLQKKGDFEGSSEDWQALTEQYGGNPLALQIVASNILDFFQGSVSDFLAEGQVVFEGLSAFLQQQWMSLTPGERWVLYYLAMRREVVSFKDLKNDLLESSLQRRFTEILAALNRRSLVEKHTHSGLVTFCLQAAVLEYATFRFVETVGNELVRSQPNLLHQCPLLKNSSVDYIQKAQQDLLLQPVLEHLKETYSDDVKTAEHLSALLKDLQDGSQAPSYAPGNLVNLLIQLNASFANRNLSNVPLWEANLASIPLHRVNLSHCDLSRTTFANAFSGVTSIAFNPSEPQFATGHEDGTISLWNTSQGRQLQTFNGHQSWVWSLCWALNRQWLISASEDQTLRVWDLETGDCLHRLEGHHDRIWRVVSLSPSVAVSTSSDQTIKIWNLETGVCLKTLTGCDGDITALSVGDQRQEILTGGADQTLRCWDWNTGNCLDSWQSELGGIWAIAYSQSTQRIYSAGDRGVIEVWERGTATPIQTLGQRSARIWSLVLSPCERYLVAGGESQHLVRWDLHHNRIDQTMTGYDGRIWSVDYSPDHEQVVTASEDNTIRLWNINHGKPLLTLSSYSNWACEVAMIKTSSSLGTPSLRVVSAYGDGNLYLWNADSGTLAHCFQGHQRSAWALASHPTGTHLVSGSEDHTLRIWEISSGQCQAVLRGHQRQIWTVDWSPDGQVIASGSGDRTIKLWDATSGDCLLTLEGHQSRVWSVGFSPDSQFVASGSGDRTIKLWDRGTGTCAATLEGHQGLVLAVAFHPQEALLASVGGDGTCKLWNLTAHDCVETISIPEKMIWSVAWSPDGTQLAMGGDNGIIRIWSYEHRDWVKTISGHRGCIWAIAYSLDGTMLVSGSQDGTTRLWDISTGQCQQILQPKRLYEGLNIMDATGLTSAQIQNLELLGARS